MHKSISTLLAQANVAPKVLLFSSFTGVHRLHDFAEVQGFNPGQIARTVLWQGRNNRSRLDIYCLAIGPVYKRLDLDKMAAQLNVGMTEDMPKVRHLKLAPGNAVSELLGHPLDGVSPLACNDQRIRKVFMDDSLLNFPAIVINAGATGVALQMAPQDIARLTRAMVLPLDQPPREDTRWLHW